MLQMIFRLLFASYGRSVPLGALSLLAWGLYFLPQSAPGQAIPYAHYSMEAGLPSATVYQVLEDQQGLIWIATDRGVVRFDGYQFSHFNTARGLPLQDIWQLREDGQGRIFLGSYYPGIIYIEGDTVIALPDTTGKNWRSKPSLKGDDQVYYELDGEYYYLKNGEIARASWTEDLPANWYYLSTDAQGRHYLVRWLADAAGQECRLLGLARWEDGEVVPLPIPAGMRSTTPPSDSYRKGTLLLRTADSLYRLHLATQQWESRPLRALGEARGNKRLLPRQMLRLGDSIFHFGPGENSLRQAHGFPLGPGEGAYRYFSDRVGNWWVATSGQGLYLFSKNALRAERLSPPSIQVSELELGPHGSVYFLGQKEGYGPRQRNLYRSREGRVERLDQPLAQPNCLLWHRGHLALAEARVGDDFLFWQPQAERPATEYRSSRPVEWNWGLPQRLPSRGTAEFIRFPGGKPALKDWWYDAANDFLYAGYHRGLMRLRPVPGMDSCRLDFFRGPRMEALVGGNDTLYWGNSSGLYRSPYPHQGEEETLKVERMAFFQRPILQLRRHPGGGLFLGTDGYGLWYWPGTGAEAQGPLPGTEGAVINALSIDSAGLIWAATREGIWAYRAAADAYVLHRHLGRSAGLPARAVQDLACRGSTIYAATGAGLVRLPNKPGAPLPAPILTHPRWECAGEELPDSAIRLAHDYGRLSLRYTALAYTRVENIRYYFRLLGADSAWQQSSSREREFLNLQPGDYRFELYARAGQGPKSELYSQTITVAAPWWQEPWSQLLALVLAIAGLPLLVWAWQRRKRIRIQQRSALEQRLARLELEALQAQMNPHFIFNALTAIQHYILENNLEEADRYLVKFARLMRGFLEASKSRYISLQEELRLLRLYLDLEQLRHPQRFTVEWVLPEPLDPSLELPTLLLQPFVENAVNHGLRDAQRPGKLRIAVRNKLAEGLEIIIEDNGIGRVAAARRPKTEKRPSRGLELLRDRLRVLEAQSGQRCSIRMEDAHPGTRVTLEIGGR